MPNTVVVIQKKYDDLSESDCVLLLNVHCNDLRGEDAVDLSSGLDRDRSPCAPSCETEMPHDGAHGKYFFTLLPDGNTLKLYM